MLADVLKLNRDKTELLVIGTKHKVNPPIKGIHVAGEYIEVSNNARNLGVIFDLIRETCYEHLQNGLLSFTIYSKDKKLISSKVDFCNVLQYGLPQSVIDRLQ